MKNLGKILVLFLALLMLAGCGDPEPAADPDKDTSQTVGDSTNSTESQKPSRTVRVLTGVTAVAGDATLTGTVSFNGEGITLTESYGSYTAVTLMDLQGRTLSEQETGENGELYTSETYEYDDRGNMTANYTYREDGSRSTYYLYTYNNLNQRTRQEQHNGEGDVIRVYEYTYHKNGKLKSYSYYNYLGELTTTVEYIQDDQGRTIRSNETDVLDDGWRDGYYSYPYDDQGRMTSVVWTDDNTTVDSVDYYYRYDEADRVVHFLSESDFGIATEATYTYDEDGYLLTAVEDESAATTFLYEQLELPGEVADAAEAWSKDGIIDRLCYTPDHDRKQ